MSATLITMPPTLVQIQQQQFQTRPQLFPYERLAAEQFREQALEQLNARLSLQQYRMEPQARVSMIGLPSSMIQLHTTARNAAAQNRYLAEAEALEAKNAELRKQAEQRAKDIEAESLDLLEAAEKELSADAKAKGEELEKQKQSDEEARKNALKAAEHALEHPEEVELALLPERIAEAKFYNADADKIEKAERIYRERTLQAFYMQATQERLLRAVSFGRCDSQSTLASTFGAPATVVQRVVPVPLPRVVTTSTHTVPVPQNDVLLASQTTSMSEPKEKKESNNEDTSTAASEAGSDHQVTSL